MLCRPVQLAALVEEKPIDMDLDELTPVGGWFLGRRDGRRFERFAKIKGATQAFDKGRTNVFDALDTIVVEIEAYRSGAVARRKAA
jgi:hypothetical protein